MTVQTLVTSALVSWLVILTFMLNCVVFVPRRAIAVRLNVKNMIMTTASAALSPVGAVLNLAARWRRQWHKSHYVLIANQSLTPSASIDLRRGGLFYAGLEALES